MKNKTIAIITARGGSKRIPRKNIRLFWGKPIICYAIEAALACGSFDVVMVSTDDDEIAAIAGECGADVPFMRSPGASGDHATTDDVLSEVLADYRQRGEVFERFCCIYPTCPLLSPQRLREAMALLDSCDAVMPVVAFSHPPQRGVVIEEGHVRRMHPEHYRSRSQDLETIYHDAGQFYACRTEAFLVAGTLDVAKMKPIVLSEMEAQDIDSGADWELAKLKFAIRHSGGSVKSISKS